MVGQLGLAPHRMQLERLEQVERHQRYDTLSVRRNLPYLIAVMRGADRIDPAAGVARQVVGAQRAPGSRGKISYRTRDLSAIKVFGLGLGDLAQRARMPEAAPDLARARRGAACDKRFGPAAELGARRAAMEFKTALPADC